MFFTRPKKPFEEVAKKFQGLRFYAFRVITILLRKPKNSLKK